MRIMKFTLCNISLTLRAGATIFRLTSIIVAEASDNTSSFSCYFATSFFLFFINIVFHYCNYKTPLSITSSKFSSPSALGLLLWSSIFRELVEKNTNVLEKETNTEEIKNQGLQVSREDDEYGRLFFEGIGDIPFVCSSNRESIELQEKELHYML
ncbi:hypothetical protein UlMin_027758 [Ulmus minor]